MGPIPEFTAQVESRNRVARLALGGELDLASTPTLVEHLSRVESDGVDAIVMDLRNLTFVDSTGLHAFLQAWKRAQLNGHRLVLVGVPDATRRLIELTKTEFLVDDEGAMSLIDRFTGGRSRRSVQDGPGDDGGV